MKSDHATTRSPRLSLWLSGLAAAGLVSLGAASLSAQTTATWNGGPGSWSNGTLWSTGIVPNGTAYDVYIDGGKTSTASVVSLDGNYTFGRLTLDTGDTVNVVNDVQFTVSNGAFSGSGSIVNNGTINFQSASNGDSLRFNGAGSISGTGTIYFSGPNGHIFANNAGDRITIGAGQTITGTANLGTGTTTFTNNGTIIANISGVGMYLQPGGGTGDFTNNGTLQAVNGGQLVFSNAYSGTLTNNGVFDVESQSKFTVPAGALTNLSGTTLTGGTYSVNGNDNSSFLTTLSLGGGSIATNNATVILNGPHAVFNEINALANNASGGSFTVSNGFNFTTAGALTNVGSILASGSTLTVSGTLINSGQALTSNSGSVAVQGNTTNSGLIRTQGGTLSVQGTLNSSGVLQTSLGGTGGTISSTGALTQTSAGTLLGSGSVTAPTLALAGSLRPGDERSSTTGAISAAVGALTLNGQVGLVSGTSLLFDLAGTTASDRMAVNGALTLDGTLNVNAVAGFGAGRYDLIDYTGALTNNTLDLGTLPSGYNYRIDTGMAGQVDLVVTSAVPEPATWLGGLLSLGLVTLLRRRLRA